MSLHVSLHQLWINLLMVNRKTSKQNTAKNKFILHLHTEFYFSCWSSRASDKADCNGSNRSCQSSRSGCGHWGYVSIGRHGKVNNIKLPIDKLDLKHYLLRKILGSNIIPWQPSQLAVLITVYYINLFHSLLHVFLLKRQLNFNNFFSRHMCMVMRGVQKPSSKTVTSCMLGALREDPRSRDEFLTLIRDRDR